MTYFHIQIATERRTAERATANAIQDKLYDMGGSLGPNHLTDDNIVFISEWDLVAPFVTVLKGDHATRSLDFAGWPTVTKEQFEALPE